MSSLGLKDKTRPDLSYRISKIQGMFENACVRDLRECKKKMEYATFTSTRGIHFSKVFFLGMMRLLQRSVTPVSVKIRNKLTESLRTSKSQQACITALASGNVLSAEKMLIHPLSWSSTRIRRACRSTLTAEAYEHCPMPSNMDYGCEQPSWT